MTSPLGSAPEDRAAGKVQVWPPILRQLPAYADWARSLIERTQDLLCIHNLEGHLLSVNPAAARLLGYSVEELLQIPMRELVAPEFRPEFDQYLTAVAREGEAHGLLAVLTRSGEQRIWEFHNILRSEDGSSPVVRGVACDVTDRKRAELRLRESEERHRSVIAVIAEGVLLVGTDGKLIDSNPSAERILGANHEVLTGIMASPKDWESFTVHEDGSRFASDEFPGEVTLRTGRPQHNICMGLQRAGSVQWLLLNSQPLCRSGDEKPYAVVVSFSDITDRKRAELALRNSEERLRLAQEVARIGTFERNFITGETSWTPEMEAMYGLAPGTYPRTIEHFLELIHPEDRGHVSDLVAHSMESGEVHGEWRVVLPDGTVHWIVGRWKVFKDANGRPARAIGMDYDITDRKRIEEELRQAQEKLTEEKHYLEQQIDAQSGFEEILGTSKPLKGVMDRIAKVSSTDATVLLLGETGTGKELVARALHRLSSRSKNAFIKMNCAAIPSGLMESELFGFEKGAFTSASGRKIGRVELADKGTLFLDEIGEIPLMLQPKLLRVLQDMEFERLGGTQTLKVDFRLVAATNRDLDAAVRENEFRSDLYYRLKVFPICIPPLRDRREDIPLLVEHFVRKFARKMNKKITSIPTNTLEILTGWDWPGNVRELENFIERSVILTRGTTLTAPLSELEPLREVVAPETLVEAERELIMRALRESRGRISGPYGAARRLGLKRTTLQSKLKQMGIDRREPDY